MDDITRQSYATECRNLAAQIVTEAHDDERDVQDVLCETIDGHEWVIYTHQNHGVLQHGNAEAYTENYDSEMPMTDGGEINWALLAYAALESDVQALLDDAETDWQDAHEDDDDGAA